MESYVYKCSLVAVRAFPWIRFEMKICRYQARSCCVLQRDRLAAAAPPVLGSTSQMKADASRGFLPLEAFERPDGNDGRRLHDLMANWRVFLGLDLELRGICGEGGRWELWGQPERRCGERRARAKIKRPLKSYSAPVLLVPRAYVGLPTLPHMLAGVGWNDPCSGRSIRAWVWVRDLAFWNRSAEKKHV